MTDIALLGCDKQTYSIMKFTALLISCASAPGGFEGSVSKRHLSCEVPTNVPEGDSASIGYICTIQGCRTSSIGGGSPFFPGNIFKI